MNKLLLFLLLLTSLSAFANWELVEQVDDFEETKSYFLFSDKVDPNKPMSWPHNKAKAYLYFQCESKVMSMQLTMNNLVNEDSYLYDRRYIDINLKVDGEIHRDLKAQQKLLSDYIHFTTTDTKSREVYKTMFDAKEVIVQLDHFGNGKRTYNFNMDGLKPLMVNQCSLEKPESEKKKISVWTNWLNS